MISALFDGLTNPTTPDVFIELAAPANLLGAATRKDIEEGRFSWVNVERKTRDDFLAFGHYTIDTKKITLNIQGYRDLEKSPGIDCMGSVIVTDETGAQHVVSGSHSGAEFYFCLANASFERTREQTTPRT